VQDVTDAMGISRLALYDNNAPVSSAKHGELTALLSATGQLDIVIVMLSVSAADSPAQPQNSQSSMIT
jgi:hypothetical protein